MRDIQNVKQLHALQDETYVYAAIVAIVIIMLSIITAWIIAYKGGDDRSYIKRRICWIVWTVVGVVGFWLYNDLYVKDHIKQVALQNQFSATNLYCLFITLLGSVVISLVVMVCFRRSKFGSILGKKKNA